MSDKPLSQVDAITGFEYVDKDVLLVNTDNTIMSVSNECASELGLTEECVGNNFSMEVPYGDDICEALVESDTSDVPEIPRVELNESVIEEENAYLVGENSYGVELFIWCQKGVKLFNVDMEQIACSEGDDKIAFLFDDVTEELVSEKQLKHLLGVGNDVVGVIKSPTRIKSLNVVGMDKVGSNYEMNVENLYEVIHDKDKENVESKIRAVEDDGGIESFNCRLQVTNDDWAMFELTIHNADFTHFVEGMLLTGVDVTDQYFFEQRRQVMNRVLRHDLRNDMNVVIGHADILAEICGEDSQLHIEQIREKADSLVTVGEKVRKIDRQLHGVKRNLKQVDLSRMVEEEVTKFHKKHPEVNIRMQVTDAFVVGNVLVRTAITNALENAVEHNDKDTPEIEVEVKTTYEQNGEKVVLEVRDNGPGMPEGERQVIMDGVETPLAHISGLGLWMMKWIINGVGGELIIDSNTPNGTIVVFEFTAANINPSSDVEKANVLEHPGIDFNRNLSNITDDEPIGTSTR